MTDRPETLRATPWQLAAGWAVHVYTASGLILAAWIVTILMKTDRSMDDYRFCFLLMVIGTFVDATDGTFARLARARETIAGFDGRRLSDLVGFLMSACLPLLLIDRAGLLPVGCRWALLAALAASAFWFARTDRTADGAWLGFPPCWNTVAFYLFALPVTGERAAAIILGVTVLTFVPSRYPHLTKPGPINRLLLLLSVPWGALVFLCVARHWTYAPPRGMIGLSAGFPTLYLMVAWGMSLWRWSNAGPGEPEARSEGNAG